MKKLAIIAASILTVVGCAKDSEFGNEQTRNRVQMTISAVKEVADDTRIEFNNSVYDMLWEADDQIGVYVAGTGEKATFELSQLGDDRKSARFSAEIDEPNATDDYYAFYPANTEISGTNVNFVIPAETEGVTTPYLVAAAESVAMTDVELNFKPVTALLELSLGFAADKVIVEGNNGESLAGVYSYNIATGTPNAMSGSKSVTLTSPAAGVHYLYMPAITLEKGYKITVEVGGQKMIKSANYSSGKTFVAGEVTSLNIDTFEPVTITLADVVTTYTMYTRGDQSANSSDAHTIWFNGNCSFSGISTTLIEEVGVCYGTQKIVGTLSGKNFTVANATNVSKGAYDVYAYVRVGGVEYKSAVTKAYITGLPYSAPFNDAATATSSVFASEGWTGNDRYSLGKDTSYDYCVKLKGGEKSGDSKRGYVISPEFPVPADVNVNVTVELGSMGGKDTEIGVASKSVSIGSWSYSSMISTDVTYKTTTTRVTISSQNPCVLFRTTQYKFIVYGFTYMRNFDFQYAF